MPDYRPRSASELVDAAFSLLRRDYKRFCLTMAVLTAPWLLVQLVITRTMNIDLSGQRVANPAALGVLALAGLLWYALAASTMMRAAADAYEHGAVDPVAALRAGVRRYPAVLGAMVLKYLLLGAMFIAAAIVSGIFVGLLVFGLGKSGVDAGAEVPVLAMIVGVVVTFIAFLALLPFVARYAAVPATAVLEPLGPLAAMRRSRELVKGHAKRALTVVVLGWVVYLVVGGGASLLAGALGPVFVQQLVGALVQVLLYPLLAAIGTVLYYDLRFRQEGYDLELMADALAPAVSDGVVSPVPAR